MNLVIRQIRRLRHNVEQLLCINLADDTFLDDAGKLRAVHRDRPFRVGGTGAIADGKLEVEVSSVGYGDKGMRLPRWVRIVRELELPPLSPGMRLVDAHRIGDQVSFRVVVADVKLDIDLDRVRTAIMRGAAVPVA